MAGARGGGRQLVGAGGGGHAPALRTFRAQKQKVNCSWEDMQRRLARRAGLVSEFEDRPRLLAAAEEVTPSALERTVDYWPHVARPSSGLARLTSPMLESSGHMEDGDNMAPELEDMIPWLTEALGEDYIAEHLPLTPRASAAPSPSPGTPTPRPRTLCESTTDSLGFRTPPCVYPARGKQLGMRQQLENALIEIEEMQPGGKEPSHLAGSGLEGEVRELSPRTIARQQYDLYNDPFSAADEFTLARRKAKRETIAVLQAQAQQATGWLADLQVPLVSVKLAQHAGNLSAESTQQLTVRDKVLDRLEYLQACREVMGDERFSNERQRFEMHSQLLSAAKYSIEEKPQDLRSAFSLQVRGLKDDGGGKSGRKKVRRGAFSAPESSTAGQLRPSTAPEPSSTAAALPGVGLNDHFPPRPVTSEGMNRDRLQQNKPDLAKRSFHFASKCKENRVAMPCLGTFSLSTPQATPRQRSASPEKPTEMSLSHWSLGDKPLLAIAASPMKDCLASVEEGGFSGNRITNKGVSALVSNLGKTTSLDLSENRFDSRCTNSLAGFFQSNHNLRHLILSRNRLSDESVAQLCRKMAESCPALNYVGLSDVQIGSGILTGPVLGALLETAPKLRGLDLSYNMLQGPGAIAVLDGIINSRLEILDIGWNCLGQGSKSTNVAEQLASLLRDNDSLFHLDISFNRFKCQDAAVLARGLRFNRTLWGIHLEGNSAVLDVDGFMHSVSNELPASPEPPLTARAGRKKKGKAGTKVKSARGKDATEAEAESSAFGLTPEEMEARARALENHIAAMDESWAWQVKWDEQEHIRKTRGELFDEFGWEGTAEEKSSGKRYGIVLPDVLDPDLLGEAMDPRKQDSWLQTLSHKVRPDVCGAVRTLSNKESGKHNHTDSLRPDCKCWLCGAWVEVVIEIDAVSLQCDVALKPEAAVCVLLSIDNFSRPTPLLPCSTTEEKTVCSWRGSRFLPPTEEDLHMVLQVGDCLKVIDQLTIKDLQRPLRLPLWNVGTGAKETVGASHDEILQVNILNVASLAEQYVAAAAVSRPVDTSLFRSARSGTLKVLKHNEETIAWVNQTAAMACAGAKDAGQQPPHAMLLRQRWPTWSQRTSDSGSKIVAPPKRPSSSMR